METVYIYTLENPITEEIRYVGKTNNPKDRFKNHCNRLHNIKSHKRNWINSLKEEGLKPIITIIDEVPKNNWQFWEKYWVSQFKTWGFNLCNHTEGGDGSTFANQTSFKKGDKPWNYGTVKPKILKGNHGKSENSIKTQFKKEHTPWNKDKKDYKLKGLKESKKVSQYTLNGEYIQTFLGCKEASNFVGCLPESIRLACIGKNKTAKKFKWKYE